MRQHSSMDKIEELALEAIEEAQKPVPEDHAFDELRALLAKAKR